MRISHDTSPWSISSWKELRQWARDSLLLQRTRILHIFREYSIFHSLGNWRSFTCTGRWSPRQEELNKKIQMTIQLLKNWQWFIHIESIKYLSWRDGWMTTHSGLFSTMLIRSPRPFLLINSLAKVESCGKKAKKSD